MSDKQKPPTKTEVFATLSDKTGLTKKQIGSVLDELAALIKTQLGKKGPGVFVLPGLLKIKRHVRPKTKERWGTNPQDPTGPKIKYDAKPARTVVKVLALKNLKEMVK
jgi:nucleoid DNA-binding protein